MPSVVEKGTGSTEFSSLGTEALTEHLLELGLQVQTPLLFKEYIIPSEWGIGYYSIWGTVARFHYEMWSLWSRSSHGIKECTDHMQHISSSWSLIFPFLYLSSTLQDKVFPWSWRKWGSLDVTSGEKTGGRAGSLSQARGRRRKWSLKNKVLNTGPWAKNRLKDL